MQEDQVLSFFSLLEKQNPHPKSELHYTNTYTLLVAVSLSAQATDKGVNEATKNFFKYINSPKKMIAWGEEKLKQHIQTIGLYKTKAKNILKAAHILVNQFHGEVPKTREELESLPGVGRKTANVVLNVAFHQPVIAVDTHIFRVCNRTGLAKGKTPLVVEKKLEKIVPKKYLEYAHLWLVLHGRYVCKARKPLCNTCMVRTLCAYPLKTLEPS